MNQPQTKDEIRFLSSSGGKYAAFSNFYPSPFTMDGYEWPTVEHYFQAAKFVNHPSYYERIHDAATPLKAKDLGQNRRLTIVADWDRNRCTVMARALNAKFEDPTLRELLLSTGNAKLIEANTHDEYWGIGSGKGANHLGRLLMKLRDQLQTNNKN